MGIHTPRSAVSRQSPQAMLDLGLYPAQDAESRVVRSWQRSLAAGLEPSSTVSDAEQLSGSELRRMRSRHQELLAYSQPVMEHLFEQVRDSHSMVVLSESSGVLMYTLGEADFLSRAERVALAAGATWGEQSRGTNAIGAVLAEKVAMEIHGQEHFLERNQFLTCAAAPIFNATGSLLGILDISGDHRSRHPHTLGLVNSAARMIENRLMVANCNRRVRIHLHPRAEGIGTLAEGILALSEDGWIVGANRNALKMLALNTSDLGATPLSRCLVTRFDDLLSWAQRRADEAVQVVMHDGSVLFAQVHPVQETVKVVPKREEPVPQKDALTRLDTGDARWRTAADKARRIVDKPIPLLLHGESGVGKELFARACHETGPRRNGPFVAINCAALPENLIEAELFGYTPGAFTGARREGSPGRLREAHGGTLFLDEIGDMPLSMQTRLLRVLQEREVTPLGGGKPTPVDFALICATHHNLRQATENGSFRSDLYYRINGLTLHLPALRERDDFQALTMRVLDEFAPGRHLSVNPDLLRRLAMYAWPGNLRQYSSLLRTAVAMLDEGENRIDWGHLPDDVAEELQTMGTADSVKPEAALRGSSLAELSMVAIRQALEAAGGNVSAAARKLGVSRQTLYRKLKHC